jgi:tRNA (guanine-N7-)-methyltransferase
VQQRTLEDALPRLLLELSSPPPQPLSGLFPIAVNEIRLEIGFGGGEHLLSEARRFPEVGFIGVEPFRNGLAKAVTAIEAEGIRNIRLFDQDAVPLLDWLPAESLARIDLLFPDPWPRPRHWRRRFIQPENLDRVARCLKRGGVFRFASDVDAYVKWTLRVAGTRPHLHWTEGRLENCRKPWEGWPGTRYGAKAARESRAAAYLTFIRKGDRSAASAQESPAASGENHDSGSGNDQSVG